MDLSTLSASDGLGESSQATVTAIRTAGANSITVGSLSHWPTKFIATTGALITVSGTNQKTIDPTTMLVFAGHVSAGKIIIDTLAPGYTDTRGSAVNDVVIIKPTTYWADGVATAIQAINGIGSPIAATFSSITDTGNLTVSGNVSVTGTITQTAASTTTGATITPTKQVYSVTALAVGATINTPSFAASDGMAMILRIKDNGTSRTLTFAAGYTNVSGLSTPTATVAGKLLTIGVLYNASTTKWEIQGINVEA